MYKLRARGDLKYVIQKKNKLKSIFNFNHTVASIILQGFLAE